MILVTGGCGFIGATLVPRLVASGYKVRVYDKLAFGRPASIDDTVEIVRGDIRDINSMIRSLEGVQQVIHLAAAGSVIDSIADPQFNFESNVVGTFSILKACQEANVARLVFASTGGALMGNASPPVDETSLPLPISPYGASKLCGEAYLHAFAGAYGLHCTALRFANVYGPHSAHKKGAVTEFIKRAIKGEPLVVYDGGAESSRDFLYVDDLCVGIEAALSVGEPMDNVFHLASEEETTIAELAKLIIELADSRSRIVHRPHRRGEVERNFAVGSRAARALGFRPAVSLREGMQRTIDWFNAERTEWERSDGNVA